MASLGSSLVLNNLWLLFQKKKIQQDFIFKIFHYSYFNVMRFTNLSHHLIQTRLYLYNIFYKIICCKFSFLIRLLITFTYEVHVRYKTEYIFTVSYTHLVWSEIIRLRISEPTVKVNLCVFRNAINLKLVKL